MEDLEFIISSGDGGSVYSVNGKVGNVVLTATDVNALPDTTVIPTKTSDLTNDSGFIDNTYHDTTKQDNLISGTNIKTINSQSILGSGDIAVSGVTDVKNYNDLSLVTGTEAKLKLATNNTPGVMAPHIDGPFNITNGLLKFKENDEWLRSRHKQTTTTNSAVYSGNFDKAVKYALCDTTAQGALTYTAEEQEAARVRLGIPATPTVDGTYVLKCTVSDGTASYDWV